MSYLLRPNDTSTLLKSCHRPTVLVGRPDVYVLPGGRGVLEQVTSVPALCVALHPFQLMNVVLRRSPLVSSKGSSKLLPTSHVPFLRPTLKIPRTPPGPPTDLAGGVRFPFSWTRKNGRRGLPPVCLSKFLSRPSVVFHPSLRNYVTVNHPGLFTLGNKNMGGGVTGRSWSGPSRDRYVGRTTRGMQVRRPPRPGRGIVVRRVPCSPRRK